MGDLVERLKQIADHNWRVSFLAHTSDTAGEAAAELTRLTAERDAAIAREGRLLAVVDAARRTVAHGGTLLLADALRALSAKEESK